MCALCGAFGGAEHWTDRPAGKEGGGTTPAAERQRRATAANAMLAPFGLTLSEWGGRYTLRSRTGAVAIVDHFGMLWAEAERLTGRPCDPLDPKTIAAAEENCR